MVVISLWVISWEILSSSSWGVFKEETTQSVLPCRHGWAGDTFCISEFKSSPGSLIALPANTICGMAGAGVHGSCWSGGDHLAGSSIQDSTGVKAGLYRQLWAGTQLGSSGWAGVCHCVLRGQPGAEPLWGAPVCCPWGLCLWATAGMCLCASCCLYQLGLLYLALTEVCAAALLFPEVILILVCPSTSQAQPFQTQLPEILAFHGYLFQLGCYSLCFLLGATWLLKFCCKISGILSRTYQWMKEVSVGLHILWLNEAKKLHRGKEP